MLESPPRLILGSSSRYRQELLLRLQIAFEAISPGTVEDPMPQESAEHLALRLARAKARDVAALLTTDSNSDSARRLGPCWIIGCDQAAVRANGDGSFSLVGKPDNHAAAVEQLLANSGKTLVFNSAICLIEIDALGNVLREQTDNAPVTAQYRHFDRASIERYLAREPAYDCAGSMKSEGLGIAMLESCQSDDPTALIGLPLISLSKMLRHWGLNLP